MPRVLLIDDSPHAQRMGETLLHAENCQVVTVSDGLIGLVRLDDVDPDLVLVDFDPPRRSGFDICEFIKAHPRHRHVQVAMMASPRDAVDPQQAQQAGADVLIRKPLDASTVQQVLRPMFQRAVVQRALTRATTQSELMAAAASPYAKDAATSQTHEAERIRAAVTVAMDAALDNMIDDITKRVLLALGRSDPAQPRLFD